MNHKMNIVELTVKACAMTHALVKVGGIEQGMGQLPSTLYWLMVANGDLEYEGINSDSWQLYINQIESESLDAFFTILSDEVTDPVSFTNAFIGSDIPFEVES